MSETDRWALPLLEAGQAQKEITHNEALTTLDLLTGAAVVAVGLDTPPPGPVLGQCWVVGDAPTGDWAGRARALAGWTAGGWRFIAPREGLSVWSAAAHCPAMFAEGRWRIGEARATALVVGGVQVVGAQAAAIPAPAGGATVDVEARGALAAILTALRGHGLVAP